MGCLQSDHRPQRRKGPTFPTAYFVAVGDASGNVVLWNPTTGHRVGAPLNGGGGSISSIDFDRHGRLITTSDDGQLRLWDLATRTLIGKRLPGPGANSQAEFFPIGSQVLDVSTSGKGVLWNVDPAAWQARACAIANRNLARQEWNEYLPGRSYARVCP